MKSLQNYIDSYREIATNLNLQGDSVELLIQLLANATYISEVENIAYVKEASLEDASLLNSKIQHCMDLMYSVYRGLCPRIIFNIKATKYITYNLYDVVTTSNNFKLYYLGVYDNTNKIWNKSNCTLIPDNNYQLMCLLSGEMVSQTWTLSNENTYYVDCDSDNLSNDIYVKIKKGTDSTSDLHEIDVTTKFSDHILNNSIFDLTLPGLGSRLFLPEEYRVANTEITAKYFIYSTLSSFNSAELKRIKLDGAEFSSFDSSFLTKNNYDPDSEAVPGILYLDSEENDTLETIHYKANKDRYVNSVIRSNSDIGTLLEEVYPDKVSANGTSYKFVSDTQLDIYYIPYNILNPVYLTDEEVLNYTGIDSERRSYYVTQNIRICKGVRYSAIFNIGLELYESESVTDEVNEILATYSGKFNTNLEQLKSEIKSTIAKVSNIKTITDFSITYKDELGNELPASNFSDLDLSITYFVINPKNTTITTKLG